MQEYLGLIRDAKYVVADSFHATVFSIQFKKKFLIFYPEKSSIRIRDLLETTGLSNHGVNSCTTSSVIDETIDYNKVDGILSDLRNNDSEYLKTITKIIV